MGRLLREAGTAIWIGGQLFGMIALPAGGAVLMRRRDRHRAVVAAWRTWTPVAFGAVGLVVGGTLLERRDRAFAREHRHGRIQLTAALLALASTAAATVLGEVIERDLSLESSLVRNSAGVPVAHLAHRRFLQLGMIPINLVHGLAAAGLMLAGE